MKKFVHKIIFFLLILSISLMSLSFFNALNKKENNVWASESEELTSQIKNNVSIFIRKPTYSIFYEKKFYFIDEADELLKIFDTNSSSFDTKYLSLKGIKIIDVSFIAGEWYLLVSEEQNNKVIKIDLLSSGPELDDDFEVEIDSFYKSFFAQNITFDDKDYTLFTFSALNKNSKVALFDHETKEIDEIEIKFNTDDQVHTDVQTGLKKTISYQSSNNILYIIFIYDYNKIAYYSINSLSGLTELKASDVFMQTLRHTTLPNEIIDLSESHIMNVSLPKIADVDYLAFSLLNVAQNKELIQLFSFDFESGTETIKYKTSFDCQNSKYLGFYQDYYTYVDATKQQLFFNNISDTLVATPHEIDNPNYNIDYLAPDEFVYKKTNKSTMLFSDPWGSRSSITIPESFNVIKIGTAKITSNDLVISDYDYCLYTYNDYNYCGFINNADLLQKEEITPKNAGYKERVTIWPRTILYSLPTTITAGKIGMDDCSLFSQRLMIIEDNSVIEVLDVLCNYIANNTKIIKILVNGKYEGYIDANCVRNPSDVRNFVITNATIKNDNTTVYLSPDLTSTTLTFALNAGKNVRINGKRDTKTGFTSITFNDEYGNEFSGYIETDYIEADTWSSLQIIGCILIAINLGLLVLILIYKKNHLGSRGQKIEKEN